MESVGPTPNPFPSIVEISFTDAQMKIISGKKKTMKDIVEIQRIYGKLEGAIEKFPREVARFLQRRNEFGKKKGLLKVIKIICESLVSLTNPFSLKTRSQANR